MYGAGQQDQACEDQTVSIRQHKSGAVLDRSPFFSSRTALHREPWHVMKSKEGFRMSGVVLARGRAFPCSRRWGRGRCSATAHSGQEG